MTGRGDTPAQTRRLRPGALVLSLVITLACFVGMAAPAAHGMIIPCPGCGGGGGSPPGIAIISVSANGHTVGGTQGTVSWQVVVSDGSLSSTSMTCGSSGCSTSGVSQSGSTYSDTISGLVTGNTVSYTIYASAANSYGTSSTSQSGTFVPTNVAPDPSYFEWNPSYTFSGSCVLGSEQSTISPHLNSYQPGDFVYVANAAQGTYTTYDLQTGISVTMAGWCPLFYLELTSASLQIYIKDYSNANDNLATWMQVSNAYSLETSATGQGTYAWNVGLQGQTGGGAVSLGASYQAPNTVTPSYTVQQSNLGNGVLEASQLSISYPNNGGTYSVAAILPLHILDWLIPSGTSFDNIQVLYDWTLNIAACSPSFGYCGNTNTEYLSYELGSFYTLSGSVMDAVSEWSYLEPGTVSGAVG